jgi:TonB family protein
MITRILKEGQMKRTGIGAGMATGLLGAMLMLCAGTLAAQVVPPTAADTPAPPTPQGPFGPGPEGWVKVAYSVTEDGSTANVRVLQSQPAGLNPAEAIQTIQRWRFNPATADGTPIEWHNNVETIVFDIDDIPLEVSPAFAAAFEEAAELIANERFDQARTRNASMQAELISRLYEVGLSNMQLAIIELQQENYHAAYEAVRRATPLEVTQLYPDELLLALSYRFAIEVQLGLAAEALDTFERLNELEPVPADDPTRQQINALREAINSGAILPIQARVGSGDAWTYTPMRRTFAVGDVDGSLEEVGIECNRRTAVLPFQEDVEWTVPESWGECTLAFQGRRGTTFVFFEVE